MYRIEIADVRCPVITVEIHPEPDLLSTGEQIDAQTDRQGDDSAAL
jgi:hypothetical protein